MQSSLCQWETEGVAFFTPSFLKRAGVIYLMLDWFLTLLLLDFFLTNLLRRLHLIVGKDESWTHKMVF
jgi:hypothetical protein